MTETGVFGDLGHNVDHLLVKQTRPNPVHLGQDCLDLGVTVPQCKLRQGLKEDFPKTGVSVLDEVQ